MGLSIWNHATDSTGQFCHGAWDTLGRLLNGERTPRVVVTICGSAWSRLNSMFGFDPLPDPGNENWPLDFQTDPSKEEEGEKPTVEE